MAGGRKVQRKWAIPPEGITHMNHFAVAGEALPQLSVRALERLVLEEKRLAGVVEGLCEECNQQILDGQKSRIVNDYGGGEHFTHLVCPGSYAAQQIEKSFRRAKGEVAADILAELKATEPLRHHKALENIQSGRIDDVAHALPIWRDHHRSHRQE